MNPAPKKRKRTHPWRTYEANREPTRPFRDHAALPDPWLWKPEPRRYYRARARK